LEEWKMKPIFNGRVASVLLVMFFFTIGPSTVAAAVDCELDKFEFHPQCVDPVPDPDPGDGTMTLENVYGWWSGNVHDQLDDEFGTLYFNRFCEASGTVTNGYVAYGCPWENQVHFTLPLPEPDDMVGKEADLCGGLDNFVIGGTNDGTGFGRITRYHFTMDPTWNDGTCTGTDPSCLIRVQMTAYFDNWCNDRKCGRLVIIRGWGHASAADEPELNPFFKDQEIDIHDLEIIFKGIGTNRDVAECHWYNSGVQYNTDNPNR
jgi:hypothetical protein